MKWIFLTCLSLGSLYGQAQTAEQILDRYYQAVGGRERWQNVRNCQYQQQVTTYENHPEMVETKKQVGLPSADDLNFRSAIMITLDTVFIQYPYYYARFTKATRLDKKFVNFTREYFNGQVGKTICPALEYEHISDDPKINRKRREQGLSGYLTPVDLMAHQDKLVAEPEKNIDGQVYHVLAFKDQSAKAGYANTCRYLFDRETGLLSAIRCGEATDTKKVVLYANYRTFEGRLLPTSEKVILNGELLGSYERTDYQFNVALDPAFFDGEQ